MKKTGTTKKTELAVLIFMCAGAVLGIASRFLPGGIADVVISSAVSPVMSMIMGLFSGLMVPFVFLEITGAVCCRTVKNENEIPIGKMLLRFVIIGLSINTFSALISMLFFRTGSTGNGTVQYNGAMLLEELCSIVPSDLFSPFTEGNILQVVFMAFFTGICLALLGDRVSGITALVSQGRLLTERMFAVLANTLPVVALLSMFKLFSTFSADSIVSVWKVLPAVFIADFVFALVFALTVCARRKLSLKKILTAFKEPLLKAFASGTSSVTIQDVIAISEKNGISGGLVRVHAPLSFVFLSTGYSVMYVCAVFCMAEMTGTAIPVRSILSIVLLVFQFSVATPRVSGGSLAVFTVLLTQLGIPADGAAVILALSVLTSGPTTALAVFIKIIDELDFACSRNAVSGCAFSEK